MKNKNLIIGLVVAVVVVIGFVLIVKPFASKKAVKKAPAAAAKAPKGIPTVPIKKTFSKGMGGLTVKLVSYNNKEMSARIKAFKSDDSKSSTYVTSFMSNRMQELFPGTYDIEIETTPTRIYKNIKVSKERENVEDLGCITGSVIVKALNSKKRDAAYPVRILYSKSAIVVAAGTTNRPIEIAPGTYDVEVGTIPSQAKRDTKVDKGKETILDLGTTGNLIIKTVDENKKEVRSNVRIKKAENNELVTSTTANRSLEILAGTYNIEILSTPPQAKKDVKVGSGEEVSEEFLVQAPPAPVTAPVKAVPAKTAPAKPRR